MYFSVFSFHFTPLSLLCFQFYIPYILKHFKPLPIFIFVLNLSIFPFLPFLFLFFISISNFYAIYNI